MRPPFDSRPRDGVGTERYHGSYFGFDREELPAFIAFCRARGLDDHANSMQSAIDNDRHDFHRLEFGFKELTNPIWAAFDDYLAQRV